MTGNVVKKPASRNKPGTPPAASPPNKGSLKGIDSLLVLMKRLEDLHEQLHEALQRKLDAMRRASIDELGICIGEEQGLVTRIGEQEGLRRQLMEQIGRGYGMSSAIARSLPVRELAQRVPEPTRTKLLAVGGGLKSAVERVKKVNNLVNRVSTDVLRHMEAVFSSVGAANSPSSSYTDRGQNAPPHALELFEAIG